MNEITKTAPNRKPRGFVERRLSFPNCGEKSFSSSFHYLVAAVAKSGENVAVENETQGEDEFFDSESLCRECEGAVATEEDFQQAQATGQQPPLLQSNLQ